MSDLNNTKWEELSLGGEEPLDVEVSFNKPVLDFWTPAVRAEEQGDKEKAIRLFIAGGHYVDAVSVVKLGYYNNAPADDVNLLKTYAERHLDAQAAKYMKSGQKERAAELESVRSMLGGKPEELTDLEFIDEPKLYTSDTELSREDFIVEPTVEAKPAAEEVSERQSAAEIMVGGFIAAIVGHHRKGNGVNVYNHREGNSMVDPEKEAEMRKKYSEGGKLAETCGFHRDAIHNYVFAQAFGEAERVAKEHGLEMFYRSTLVEVAAQYADESKAAPFKAEFDKLRETTKEI